MDWACLDNYKWPSLDNYELGLSAWLAIFCFSLGAQQGVFSCNLQCKSG